MENQCTARYSVIETPTAVEGAFHQSYGIQAVCKNGDTRVPDVAESRKDAQALCAVLERERVCCLHLMSICEDYVASTCDISRYSQ